MEKIITTETGERKTNKSNLIRNLSIFTLCWALALSNASCGKATQKDVADQQKKIESLSFQISHYINARKELVSDYNKLLQYPKTDSNKADIERSLAQIYEVISDYDEKIKDLAEDKLEAIDDLNEYISDTEVLFIPNKPIDPNRWDFLLTIK